MLKFLKSLVGGARTAPHRDDIRIATDFEPVDLSWYDETAMPLPVWDEIAAAVGEDWPSERRDVFWTAAAGHWLLALGAVLPEGYRIHESDDFLLLSALEERPARVLLRFCQSVRRRILRNLGDAAAARVAGKHVVLVFADEQTYYDYISHYYPEGGEYAMSSGMFVHAGYGHFALFENDTEHMQPVIAHELTHCLLSHLRIPAWLNEGMAVNTEHALFPHLADPRSSLYRPNEIKAKHAAFWNADTIQEFWSGKSFLRTDDGNMLSYDLAKRIAATAARDEAAFRVFLREADVADAGLSAEHRLGYPIEHLAMVMLGEGDWRPAPERWSDGTERGQFRSAKEGGLRAAIANNPKMYAPQYPRWRPHSIIRDAFI
jgi:hypothetical protein